QRACGARGGLGTTGQADSPVWRDTVESKKPSAGGSIHRPMPPRAMPLRSAKDSTKTGYVEGQNVMVEYHWLEGQYNRLPSLMDELIRRRVAVIATPASRLGALAAKAATSTIPIVLPSAMTRSSWGWSQALPGQAAMRPAS